MGPNDLITSDPELMRRMLNVRTRYKRSAWYDAMRLDPTKDNVLSQRDDDLHASTRSKMAAGYSGKEVDGLELRIDANVQRLLDLVRRYATEKKPFDLGHKAQYFTLDVISDLAFGEPFGDLETDSDVHGYIGAMEESMPTIIVTTVMPWVIRLLQLPIFKGMLPSDKDRVGVGRAMAIAKKVTAERFGPDPKVQRDMLGSFIAKGLGQEQVESEILMQILAGADTTATAVRATLLYIISTPRVVEAMRQETVQIRSLPGSIITDDEARTLPYLQAVIKEGLRIHPPVVGLMSKEVPPEGDTFKGVYLPGGTQIGYCAWGIYRRRDIFGDDADEFRPERWLDADEEKLKLMESTLDLVFGYGRWQCLGRNVAMMELNKVFYELVRRFDLSVVDPIKPWKSINVGVFLQSEYWVRAHERTWS